MLTTPVMPRDSDERCCWEYLIWGAVRTEVDSRQNRTYTDDRCGLTARLASSSMC